MKKSLLVCSLFATVTLGFASSCQPSNQGITEIQKYTISFMVDGQIYHKVESSGNEAIKKPTSPSKEGFVFDDWYIDEGFTNKFDENAYINSPLESDIKVYAKFIKVQEMTPVKKVINFYVDGTIYHQILSNGNEKLVLPSAPVKTDYLFDGWFLDQTYQKPFDISYYESHQLVESIDVFAKFRKMSDRTPIKKTITFYVDDKVYFQLLTLGNEKLTLPSEPTKTGYKFDGWYLENTYKTSFDITYYETHELTDSINVYSKFLKMTDWTPIKKTITFYVDDKVYYQLSTLGNEKLVLPSEPTKTGYKFAGWYLEPTFINKFDQNIYLNKPLEDSINVYAKFELIEFTVKFVSNGGSVVDDFIGTKIASEPVTSKQGFTFEGWYLEPNFVNKVTFPLSLTSNLTLYAKWKEVLPEIKPFTVDSTGKITAINDKTMKVINIPETIDGIKVLSLSNMLFANNNDVTEVTLPASLNYIGYATFKNATSLRKVTINGNLTTITSSCFENCINLETVILPDTITDINADSFAYTNLTTFKAPRDLETIGNQAFKNNKNLRTIELGNVRRIYRSAFENCVMLTEVTLPNSLLDLDNDFVFLNCTNLEKITMPSNIISIARTLFFGTKYYLNKANWTNGVLYIGDYLVHMNDEFIGTKLEVKATCKAIANNAILDTIQEIILPNGFEVISKEAFMNKSSLSKVNIPASTRKIGENAFYGTAIYTNTANLYKDAIYYQNWLIGVKDVTTPNIENFVLKQGTLGIIDGQLFSFSTRNHIKTLTLNDELLYIGASSFRATNLTSVTFPSNLKFIGESSFCLTNIKEVTLSKNTVISDRSFNEDTIINRI